MEEGWVKIYRSILDFEWFDDDATVKLWLYLIIKANNKDKKWHGRTIKAGQLLTSIRHLSSDLNHGANSVQKSLNNLVDSGNIKLDSSKVYGTIITIVDYKKYQQGVSDSVSHADTQVNTLPDTLPDTKQERKKEETRIKKEEPKGSMSAGADQPINYIKLINFFNEAIRNHNSVIPAIKSISGKRRDAVNARMREFGKDAIANVIRLSAESSFMNGNNNRNWIATFDWIFRPNNFPKVLEGNYTNDKILNSKANGTNQEYLKRMAKVTYDALQELRSKE